ncbi:DMT family transporter [Sphingomonas soli]|uniref:DMT family transporter n=1 Tax=Sphingomonas soli TaxID=266127 RepID=UPI000833FF92|nr:DMT family transporter [Sphingomonas soli]
MTHRADHVPKGIALRLLAIFALASMMALVKYAEAGGASLPELLFFRQACALPIVLIWLANGPGLSSLRTKRIGSHARRTVIGLCGMLGNFGAVMLLPLAEATTLGFTVPLFATILAVIVLHETVGWHRWAAVAVGFAGILIVAQPGSGHFGMIGALVGLAGAMFTAWVSIELRQLSRTENTGTIVFWFSLLSLVPLGIAYLFVAQAHPAWVWVAMLAAGVSGGVGQLALTGALRFAPVSAVLPMDYSSLIWATLYGLLLFGVLPTPATWIGAPVIIASGLYIVWRERVRHQELATEPGV